MGGGKRIPPSTGNSSTANPLCPDVDPRQQPQTNLGRIYVGDVENTRDEGSNAEQSDGKIDSVAVADLSEEAEHAGTEKVET